MVPADGEGNLRGRLVDGAVARPRDQPIPSLRAACDGVSEQLEAVFRRMVAKKPAERYQTATEVIADLQACRTGGTVSAMVVVEEEASSDDDFQSFLKGMAETTMTPAAVKSKASLTGTQTLAKPVLTDFEETTPRLNSSNTLQRRPNGKVKPPPPHRCGETAAYRSVVERPPCCCCWL